MTDICSLVCVCVETAVMTSLISRGGIHLRPPASIPGIPGVYQAATTRRRSRVFRGALRRARDTPADAKLLSIPEVLNALHNGEFKPNCGLILVDFLMRHGIITPETEPNYIEISWRMHRRLAVGVPM